MRGQGVATPLWEREVLPGIPGVFLDLLKICGSGGVGLQRLPGECVAVGEDFINGVNLPLAAAGRWTGAERRLELWSFHGLAPHPPAGHTPGLARQVLERQFENLEPAAEACGID